MSVYLPILAAVNAYNNNHNNNLTFIMRLGNAMQTQRRRSLHIGKTLDQHLEACCRGMLHMVSLTPRLHELDSLG